jgi:hypothetical protein
MLSIIASTHLPLFKQIPLIEEQLIGFCLQTLQVMGHASRIGTPRMNAEGSLHKNKLDGHLLYLSKHLLAMYSLKMNIKLRFEIEYQ